VAWRSSFLATHCLQNQRQGSLRRENLPHRRRRLETGSRIQIHPRLTKKKQSTTRIPPVVRDWLHLEGRLNSSKKIATISLTPVFRGREIAVREPASSIGVERMPRQSSVFEARFQDILRRNLAKSELSSSLGQYFSCGIAIKRAFGVPSPFLA
jgi:hypothetical protein